ncbi:competence protein ComEA [Tissierella creatinini]|nr:competence protein ComEA [Tissierella creatinini]TJX67202.1 competence protein ComEA [Soehngenia saccharolytica]
MSSFTKGEQIVMLLIVLIVVSSLGYKFLIQDLLIPEEPTLALVDIPQTQTSIDTAEDDIIIMVHISGQVYSPGLIELVQGDRVIDAVELAGGLTKEADLDRINLAKKVEDEEKIYVPRIGESNEPVELQTSNPRVDNNDLKGNNININTATLDELDSLPGVGKVIAQRIIDYRSTSPFKTIDDLKNVSGIGDKIFSGLKDLISVK